MLFGNHPRWPHYQLHSHPTSPCHTNDCITVYMQSHLLLRCCIVAGGRMVQSVVAAGQQGSNDNGWRPIVGGQDNWATARWNGWKHLRTVGRWWWQRFVEIWSNRATVVCWGWWSGVGSSREAVWRRWGSAVSLGSWVLPIWIRQGNSGAVVVWHRFAWVEEVRQQWGVAGRRRDETMGQQQFVGNCGWCRFIGRGSVETAWRQHFVRWRGDIDSCLVGRNDRWCLW